MELKADRGRLAKLQQWVISEMKRRGADVRELKGLEAVDLFLEEVLPSEV